MWEFIGTIAACWRCRAFAWSRWFFRSQFCIWIFERKSKRSAYKCQIWNWTLYVSWNTSQMFARKKTQLEPERKRKIKCISNYSFSFRFEDIFSRASNAFQFQCSSAWCYAVIHHMRLYTNGCFPLSFLACRCPSKNKTKLIKYAHFYKVHKWELLVLNIRMGSNAIFRYNLYNVYV